MTFFDCKIHVLQSQSFNSLLDLDEVQNQQGVVRSLANLKNNNSLARNQEYGKVLSGKLFQDLYKVFVTSFKKKCLKTFWYAFDVTQSDKSLCYGGGGSSV